MEESFKKKSNTPHVHLRTRQSGPLTKYMAYQSTVVWCLSVYGLVVPSGVISQDKSH